MPLSVWAGKGSLFFIFVPGEIISNEGLVVTNHHCSFDMIQNHSSLEHNYLRDGFWAKTKAEELANPGSDCFYFSPHGGCD